MRAWPILLAGLLLTAGCTSNAPPELGDLPGLDEAQPDEVAQIATNLTTPWAIVPLPDGDVIVTERPGDVLRVNASTGETTKVTSLDVAQVGESGLMGATVHPDDASKLFVCYTHRDGSGDLVNRIARLDLDASPIEETVLVNGIAGARFHDGCRLRFDTQDRLYATMGDATRSSTAQDPDTRNGKVLRMQPDGPPAGALDDGDRYVFTMGHRNPQGIAVHPDTERVWITEHGPDSHDEVNRLVPGENYGWPDVMGKDTGGGAYQPSAWTIGEATPIAPAGGDFVDAPDSSLHGALVFANLRAAKLVVLEIDPSGPTVTDEHSLFTGEFGRLRAVQFVDDALYVSTSNTDGRGEPGAFDDRILRVPLSVLEERVG